MKAFIESGFIAIALLIALAGCNPAGRQAQPAIDVQDQAVQDGVITVSRVVAPEPGWVVIRRGDAQTGEIVASEQVSEGELTDVKITVDEATVTGNMAAVLHYDRGQVGLFEYPEGPDVPVSANGTEVSDTFNILQGPMELVPTEQVPTE